MYTEGWQFAKFLHCCTFMYASCQEIKCEIWNPWALLSSPARGWIYIKMLSTERLLWGRKIFALRDSLSKTICQGTSEGGWCRGQQRKCWMDGIKEWTSLPMPEWLTRASCCKDWKRISAEFLMSPWRPNGSRDWTELSSVRALFVFFPSPACRRICIKMLSFDRFVIGHEKFWFAGTRVHFLARNILWLGQWRC